ncbi:MAG: thiol:disulfide interchange protein DsbA/DsbL [Gammaproteobacteria bacterium]|nr:thiol:disulfide interchange protein DsbA/DsbL [Gammaproteobacteria bacterium]
MAKRKDNISTIRTGILAAVAALILIVVGVGLYYSLGFGGAASGEPYIALDKPDGSGEVDVVYFFSYECPHCRSFDDLVDGWQSKLHDGAAFARIHVAYSPSNRLLAKAHRALLRHDAFDANHRRLFRALQDRNRRFATPNSLAQFVDGFGVDRDTFLRTLTSTRTAREVEAGERRFLSLGLTGVPALVVDDKYIINMDLGRKHALDVTDDLVRELLAKRSGS